MYDLILHSLPFFYKNYVLDLDLDKITSFDDDDDDDDDDDMRRFFIFFTSFHFTSLWEKGEDNIV